MGRQTRALCLRTVATWLLVALFAFALLPAAEAGELVESHGPQLGVGFASKRQRDMVIPTAGWRATLHPGERLDDWTQGFGTLLRFPIEAAFGVVTGDEDEVEFQVVPMLRLAPVCMSERRVMPFLEGGIGLMYTGLDNLGLGSNILFSDNLAVGLSLQLPSRWTGHRLNVSYRYRHASHAGLWAESNSGLDTQYVWLGFE
jgi:hypothetical protein